MEKIRINKYIASQGVCSRRNADEYVKSGKVSVNGNIINEMGMMVSDDDDIRVEGKRIKNKVDNVYIMLNKPKGYVTTVKEQFSRPSVLDIVKVKERVYPVGRLDMDSRGLLLLTNDGEFTNKVTHPKTHIPKTYEVVIKSKVTSEDIKKLETGVEVDDYITKPAVVRKVNDTKIVITIFEGKNRQIRKMFETLSNTVIDLRRIKIGSLDIGRIREGKYVFLDKKVAEKVFK